MKINRLMNLSGGVRPDSCVLWSIALSASVLLSAACNKDKIDVTPSEDPGYAEQALVSIEALDGDKWVKGDINQDELSVTFVFHTLDAVNAVKCRVEVDPEWGQLVSPESTSSEFTLDLTSGSSITVNDGFDDLKYRVSGSVYPLIKSVTASASNFTSDGSVGGGAIIFNFREINRFELLADATVKFELNEQAELLDPDKTEIPLNLNQRRYEVSVKDKVSGTVRKYTMYAKIAVPFNMEAGNWSECTSEWIAAKGLVNAENVTIWRTDKLNEVDGRIGYAQIIPAGAIKAKLLAKGECNPSTDSRISQALHNNPDYSIYIPFQSPGVWTWDGASNKAYFSPIVYKDGKSWRTSGFNADASRKLCPPAITVKDGKAEIRYAQDFNDGKIYSYDNFTKSPTAASGTEWDVPFAVSGNFMILYNGVNLIGEESQTAYDAYCRNFLAGPNMYNDVNRSWTLKPMSEYVGYKAGRVAIGTTENGDIVVLQVAMLMNHHNDDQKEQKGQHDKFGSTMYETARELQQMGCNNAMLLDDNFWSVVLMQDNGRFSIPSSAPGLNLYGVDFFQHQIRFHLDNDKVQAELDNLAILMLK